MAIHTACSGGLCAIVGLVGALIYFGSGLEFRAINRNSSDIVKLVADSRETNIAIRDSYKVSGCEHLPIDERAKQYCSSYGGASAKPIVLWGDSHAGAWAPLFFAIADQYHLRVVMFVHGGCPPMVKIRRIDSAGRALERCSTFGTGESVVNAIKAIQPVHVFIISRWNLYTHTPILETKNSGGPNSEKATDAALQARLTETLMLVAAQSPVIVFRSMPLLQNDIARGLLRKIRFEPTLEEHKNYEVVLDGAIDRAQEKSANIRVFDPALTTCTPTCSAVLDGRLLYSDNNHVTAQGALLFKDKLVETELGSIVAAERINIAHQ